MSCPNLNSPEWKSLVSVIGEVNAWKEFIVHGKIPDASIYEVEETIKNIKAGVKEIYDSTPELAAIGTAEQYSAYLDTIFPDSKVKDIVYHISKSKIEKFDKKYLGSETSAPDTSLGFFFTDDLESIQEMAKEKEKQLKKLGVEKEVLGKEINKVILNLENPIVYNGFTDGVWRTLPDFKGKDKTFEKIERTGSKEDYEEVRKKAIENNEDGIIGALSVDMDEDGQPEILSKSIVAFEPEQIHILGNKQDIEGFKKFTETTTTAPEKVLYSIRTKTTEQIKKGINPDNIKNEQEIKYTRFILSGVLNSIGDLSPSKKIQISPDKAFENVKGLYTELKNSINLTLENFIKSDEDLKEIKANTEVFEELKKEFPVIGWVDTYDELVKSSEIYSNILKDFNKFKEFVTVELAHKGIKIKKGKFEIVEPEDVENKEQDETEDVSIANEEINSPKFDRTAFEVNPRETATVRVKGLVQTIRTGEFENGIPIYADADDVFEDILSAGVVMNLSGFTDKASKLEVFRTELSKLKEGRPYLDSLLQKINEFERKGDWEIINQILTFASKAYANESILLYNVSKSGKKLNGVTKVKTIASNRDTITEQINRNWLSRHKTSGFFNKNSLQELTPNMDKVEQLNKIRIEGKSATGDAQKRKFIEFFDVLGIKFDKKDIDYIADRLVGELNKGTSFDRIFAEGMLLDNIYKDFLRNKEEPFKDQYGFQNEKADMKVLAKLYNEVNPGQIKAASSRTADGKSKYLNIQPSHVEISKREFTNSKGESISNTALAKPNSGETGFWTKVKRQVYKFVLGYFSGAREQEESKDGKVRKNFTEKEQYATMLLKHQENFAEGTYITFTLSDKTTGLEAKMTKEFFVDSKNTPVGFGDDYGFDESRNTIIYTPKLKNKVYNSFVEPEISRILASIKHADKVNLENFDTASKLFYFIPRLNSDPSLESFRKDLYSGTKTIEELKEKYGQLVADVVIDEFDRSSDDQIRKFVTNGILELNNGNYSFPLFHTPYVSKFRNETQGSNKAITKLMMMDLKLNYMNAQIKTIQQLKFDPMHCFKAFKGFKSTGDFNSISNEDKVKLAGSTWDEFSKRAAALIAPGSQGNWSWEYDIKFDEQGNKISFKKYGASQTYNAVTLKDTKIDTKHFGEVETTDAQEYITLQEHIDYLMSEGKIPRSVWESIHNKIEGAKNRVDRYYELDAEELGYVFSPTKPVYAGNANEGEDTGLNRFDYIKTSRFPLIPEHEVGSERDKLRVWMEKNNIQSVNFASGKKTGRPALSVEVFDKENNFIEPVDFAKGLQVLSRSGLRNQQEIPHQKSKISTVSQMNRTLFDGLLESDFNFSNMKNIKGGQLKTVKENIRARLFQIATDELQDEIGNLKKTHKGLYERLKKTIEEDTTGSYTENDLKALKLGKDGMFVKSLELQFKAKKFQGLINSMVNTNVMLKMSGSSFVQVSGVGAKFDFSSLSKGVKSGIIWTDKYAKTFKNGEAKLEYIRKKENGEVSPAQVLVSQYIKDKEGKLIDLNDFITEKNGIKTLDTSRLSPEMLQLVGSRIPNQSHVSMLPIEVVGFLPSYMENTIVVPDGITGQMGSDFDVDKLYAYISKPVVGKNKDGKTTYGVVQYSIGTDGDVSKLSKDQLNQALIDIHWNVLTNPDTFDKITKSVDNPEVPEKVKIRKQQLQDYKITIDKGANLPLDFATSIDRFVDNKSGKDGVSIFASLISAQADLQDKILTLGYYDRELKKNIFQPIKIKLSKNSKEIINLQHIGKTGSADSFVKKTNNKIPTRSISDNLNIMFTESVDNAKNQMLREFNWDKKSMGVVGFLEMLTDEHGQAVPIEFAMDLTSQPEIKKLLDVIDLKQDSFGEFDSDAVTAATLELQEQIKKTIDKGGYLSDGSSAESYFTNTSRDSVLDPETLADMWLVGQAIQSGAIGEYERKTPESKPTTIEKLAKDLKFKSVEDLLLKYYSVQYDSLDLFYDLQGKSRELMTILGSIYTYTKGIGPDVFTTKQKLDQLNKLAASSNFLGIENLAGKVKKSDSGIISLSPVGEIGASLDKSLLFAQNEIYLKLFPISTGQYLEGIVSKLLGNQGVELKDIGKEKYISTFDSVFTAIKSYMYTVPDLELFDNVVETRNKLINGKESLGARILKLTEDPKFAKNGFLKNLDISPVYKSDAYTISFKAPYGTDIDEKSVTSGFYEMAVSDDEAVRQLAKDLAIYPFATGDAGNIGRFIPDDYYMNDKDFSKAITRLRGSFVSNMKSITGFPTLLDQIVQNNAESYSKKFSFQSTEGEADSAFKSILKPLINNQNDLSKVSSISFTLGNFKGDRNKYLLDSLKVKLTEAEIQDAKSQGIEVYEIDGKTLKTKYPPYILITDSYEGVFTDFADRSVKYLYKRVSKVLDPTARYERLNILGISNIKEYAFDTPDLKSVIDNNAVDSSAISMLPDNIDMSFGLTPEMFEDYSIKPNQAKAKIAMQDFNIEKIKAGTKTTTTRSDREFDKIKIPIGQSATVNFGGQNFTVTNRGLLTIEEAGGKEAMLKSEGYATVDDMLYQQTKDWVNGKGKLYVYDIKPEQTDTSKVDNTNKPEFNKLPGKSATPTMTYAGIGSRETPQEVLELMTKAAEYLDGLGYTLQTGFTFKNKETGEDEEGADKAFSQGSQNKILFGPSAIRKTVKGVASLESYDDNVTKVSNNIVKEIHPAPDRLKPGAVKLMARNTNQIFGKNLDSTVDFVLFYAQETNDPLRPKGGTGQAVEMARRKGIPTINMADANWRDQLKAAIKKSPVEDKTSIEEKGNPFKNSAIQQIVYHVDKRKNLNENTLIDDGSQVFATGAFFTTEKAYAERYAKAIDGLIYEAYVDVQSPEVVDKEDIQYYGRSKKLFYGQFNQFGKSDSLIHESDDESADIYGKVGTEIVVFEPSQIKIIKSGIPSFQIERQTDFGEYRLLYNEQEGDYDIMGPDGLEGERVSYEEGLEYISMKLAGLDQPISTTVSYKDKNYTIEGDNLSGYSVYYQKNDGSKGVLVKEDTPLYSKVLLSHAVIKHPERVVTLTDMQHSPSYFVTFDGAILSLAPSAFGEEKDSEDIHNRVMSKFNQQEELIDKDDLLDLLGEETDDFLNNQKEFNEEKQINGKKVVVPAGSNPNNMPILETKDAVYLMNDGQQEAYNFIGGKVRELLKTRSRVKPSDLESTMVFTDPLTKKFSGIIPQVMWNNMIGLAGRGGVGKTTVIKAIMESVKGENKYSMPKVMYLAPSHTAATVLQESMGLDSEKANDGTVNTLASHLRKRPVGDSGTFQLIPEEDYIKSTDFKPAFGQPDIIVIDESSMIGALDISDMVKRLNTDLEQGRIARLPVFIFMGDYRQLGPIKEKQNQFVNKGPISSTLFLDKSKTKELTQVMRSDNEYLHQIFDSVGEQIVSNMEKTKDDQTPTTPLFKKYDALTKKSTESILIVNNEQGVIDDYAEYLSTNNNPYGMFWVHYNRVDNPTTKNLAAKIRKAYLQKAGLSLVEEKHRNFVKGDYIEFTGGVEINSDKHVYFPGSDEIKKLLMDRKVDKKGDSFLIAAGVIKPNARLKVLDIVNDVQPLDNFLHPTLKRILDSANLRVNVETSILYNRQDRIRAVSKVLDLEVGPKIKGTYGKWNGKKMEGITIKNTKTGAILAKFDLTYPQYLDCAPSLDVINSGNNTMPFVPSYIGSSHTAQGNSIKNVIVGDSNIKAAVSNGKSHIDDIFSSMYVALTRTSGTLTIIKPAGFDMINNQEIYMGAITDTNNKIRPKAAIQPLTSIEEAEYFEDSRDDQEFDFDQFFATDIKNEVANDVVDMTDAKKTLNNINNNTTELNRQILSLISKTGGVGSLRIVADFSLEHPGEYLNNVISINPALAIGDDVTDKTIARNQLQEVIMHEVLHHITATLLNADITTLTADQRKWVVSLKNLFNTVQEKMLKDPNHSDKLRDAIEQSNKENGMLSAADKSMYYGLTNVHDFLTMMMTDPGFREFMNNTTYDGNKSMLDRFLDILANILKALGIQVKDNSVLKEGLINIVGLIESRNQVADQTSNLQKSISTKSSKVEMISDNFEELLKILNIKSHC
jgi:ABC-type dipeptide/oligopeptide/nickel transport system ATPase component